MNCSCVYVEGDCPSDGFYHASFYVARKEHKCDECKRIIRPGEKYEKVVAKYDGFQVFKTCPDCLSLRDAFFCEGYVHTCLWDDFLRFVISCKGEINFQALSMLTPLARAKACDIIDNVWELLDA